MGLEYTSLSHYNPLTMMVSSRADTRDDKTRRIDGSVHDVLMNFTSPETRVIVLPDTQKRMIVSSFL